jgi:hypothetical protein
MRRDGSAEVMEAARSGPVRDRGFKIFLEKEENKILTSMV